MKKISILLVAIISMVSTYAQKDVIEKTAGTIAPTTEEGEKAWKFGGGIGIFANQIALVNWSAGGVSSISGVIHGDIFANFRKGRHSWENSFRANWGIIKEKRARLRKNEDDFELNSKYGYQLDKKGKVFVGALLGFNSQFMQGYRDNEVNYSSNFLSPGYLILAAGIDWKPNDMFSLFFSPAAAKFVFVTDKGIDETVFGLKAGKNVKAEFGAYLKASFRKEIIKNIVFETSLGLYNNYLDSSQDPYYDSEGNLDPNKGYNRANIDVDWIVNLDLTVNKWITVNFGTQLLYDHDVKIDLFDKDGASVMVDGIQKTGPRTQFKESLSVGFTYRFEPKEKK